MCCRPSGPAPGPRNRSGSLAISGGPLRWTIFRWTKEFQGDVDGLFLKRPPDIHQVFLEGIQPIKGASEKSSGRGIAATESGPIRLSSGLVRLNLGLSLGHTKIGIPFFDLPYLKKQKGVLSGNITNQRVPSQKQKHASIRFFDA